MDENFIFTVSYFQFSFFCRPLSFRCWVNFHPLCRQTSTLRSLCELLLQEWKIRKKNTEIIPVRWRPPRNNGAEEQKLNNNFRGVLCKHWQNDKHGGNYENRKEKSEKMKSLAINVLKWDFSFVVFSQTRFLLLFPFSPRIPFTPFSLIPCSPPEWLTDWLHLRQQQQH